ncbi:MAG: hypothetical protein JSV64_07820 [Candidatus Bathyarchaeota archaeon]|jgi:hypothetical protein|nr:MAG: hypothetical protein JSV64_07820 [Candidatus Bathyarchaeota archaeon]
MKGPQKVEKGGVSMPLTKSESFLAKLQKGNRIQVPVLIRWKHKLDSGEIFRVIVISRRSDSSEEFYARLNQGGIITMPKIVI